MKEYIYKQVDVGVGLYGFMPQGKIVRCRDCRWYYSHVNVCSRVEIIEDASHEMKCCKMDGRSWHDDDYCSYGELKEDNSI